MYNLSAPSLVVLATIAETILLFKRFPNRSAQADPLQILLLTFAINLIIWRFYRAVIYTEFLSALKYLPTAKVSQPDI
jgi:RsiW-degrading membrane proteinase PrsW (M82 family)